MYVGTELSEEDINKLEAIKDHISGGGKLKISNSAAMRYLIREYELPGTSAPAQIVIAPTEEQLNEFRKAWQCVELDSENLREFNAKLLTNPDTSD